MSETIKIPVCLRGRIAGEALVDECDAHLAKFGWTLAGGYAVRSLRPRDKHLSASMHRQICGLLSGDPRATHHVNENKLDNRRSNLEVYASMREANRQPHPQRDQAQREGYDSYLARFMPHVLERRKANAA